MTKEDRIAIRKRLDFFAAKCGWPCVWYNEHTTNRLVIRGNNNSTSLVDRPLIGTVLDAAAAELFACAPADINALLVEVSNAAWREERHSGEVQRLERKVKRLERGIRRAEKAKTGKKR